MTAPSPFVPSPAFTLLAAGIEGRKQIHNADEIMAEIVAKRLVEHLERAGFIVMKKPPSHRRGSSRARVWDSRIAL